jgi:hypothetical protein
MVAFTGWRLGWQSYLTRNPRAAQKRTLNSTFAAGRAAPPNGRLVSRAAFTREHFQIELVGGLVLGRAGVGRHFGRGLQGPRRLVERPHPGR